MYFRSLLSLRALLPLTLGLVILNSCKDLPEEEFQFQDSELRVRVLDENLKPVTSGVVSLYLDIVSFRTRTGEVAVSLIQADGFAYFYALQPSNYFIYARHVNGSKVFDNQNAYFDLSDYLTENAVTFVTVKTKFQREVPPTAIELHSIDVMPIGKNLSYAGPDYDTLRGEFLIIQDFDGGIIGNQSIIGRTTFEFYKKPVFGEIYSFEFPDLPAGGHLEIPVTSLSEGPAVPLSLDKHTYTLFMTCFTSKKEYQQREQFYTGATSDSFNCITEVIDLGAALIKNSRQLHPWTEYVFGEETRLQLFHYDIYADVLWK